MDHQDHGGLHEDLGRTGARIGRRDMLRLAAGGMGALYLFGCSDDGLGIGGDGDAACLFAGCGGPSLGGKLEP